MCFRYFEHEQIKTQRATKVHKTVPMNLCDNAHFSDIIRRKSLSVNHIRKQFWPGKKIEIFTKNFLDIACLQIPLLKNY